MSRLPDYSKWYAIYLDSKKNLTWTELAKKHKTSKRTISKALIFFNKSIINNEINQDSKEFQIYLAHQKIKKLKQEIKTLRSEPIISKRSKETSERKKDIDLTKIEKTIEIFKSLQKNIRLKILIFLSTYNELGLTKLSKLLNISKSTIARHIKLLEKLNLVKIREEKVRGPNKKQYYSATSDLFDVTRLSNTLLRKVSPQLAYEARCKDIRADSYVFRVLRSLIDELLSYYERFQKELELINPKSHKKIEEIFSSKNISRFYVLNLDSEEFQVYKENYLKFIINLRRDLNQVNNNRNKTTILEEKYYIWHLTFPIAKIIDKQESIYDFI